MISICQFAKFFTLYPTSSTQPPKKAIADLNIPEGTIQIRHGVHSQQVTGMCNLSETQLFHQ